MMLNFQAQDREFVVFERRFLVSQTFFLPPVHAEKKKVALLADQVPTIFLVDELC